MKALEKYLQHYAEQVVTQLKGINIAKPFAHSVVVPAYKESERFLTLFVNSGLANQNALVVLVINQPISDQDLSPQQHLFEQVTKLGKTIWQHGQYSLVEVAQTNSAILMIDCFTQPLPDKQGVGLARKIGADSVVALINQGLIKSHWIASTDADASLPDDYFDQISRIKNDKTNKSVAGYFNFTHQSSDHLLHQANAQYEQALRYYVEGLTFAGSHYSFFTIGSILAFSSLAYANVRGFPKRSAGEDFYLLNKLAKLGNIAFIKESSIILQARESDRVPFGTGPAVSRILALEKQGKKYCYYHPDIFALLKEAINAFDSLYEYRSDMLTWVNKLSTQAKTCIQAVGIQAFVDKQQQTSKKQFDKQLLVWFDAFKTLKFIHYAREHYYSDLPLKEVMASAPFICLANAKG